MSDGHIPRDAVVWLDKVLKKTPVAMPVVFINHYPVDNGLDNWYEASDRIKKHNIKYVICGHGHSNQALDFEGVAGTMGRSNLRAKDSIGGYNIVTMRKDSVFFAIKKPRIPVESAWRKITLGKYASSSTAKIERPSYSINATYPAVREVWKYHAPANVVLTPASGANLVVFGNSIGEVEALTLSDGQKKWKFKTKGAIYSSPAIAGDRVIFGSGDGNIYALNLSNGKKLWKYKTGAAVLGSPVVEKDTVYIGGSDGSFRAINVKTGKQIWSFDGVEGSIVCKPLVYNGKLFFGSWGRHLYAVDQTTGKLSWKWNNGNGNRMFSPAMCTPVAHNGIVYIAAPDRFLTAIDAGSGNTLWRSKEAGVRESIGISEDGSLILGKTMNDEVVAYKAQSTDPGVLWRLNLGFGYEHVPSMLIAKYGTVTFGTKNGVIYTFDPATPKPLWAHKIDNSMVNTVNILAKDSILVATMDGVVTLLKIGQ
jgi:outer membrane protein assembly factor BamB